MPVDRARVVQIYAAGKPANLTGSGYAVSDRLVLTAAHVLTSAGLSQGAVADVALLDAGRWARSSVAWLAPELDVALLRVAENEPWDLSRAEMLRWGALQGEEDAVPVAAVGFPFAMERPSGLRDTEHLVGFVAPLAGHQSNTLQVSIVSAAPKQAPGAESAWSGMSGSALLAGPYLVGILVVDPAKYDTDRLVGVPVALLLENPRFCAELGGRPALTEVGARWRLEYAAGRSVSLAPPYRPMPPGLPVRSAPSEMLKPRFGFVPFSNDRRNLVDEIVGWCVGAAAPGLRVRTLTGPGGSGKTRLAAEACVELARHGWEAGFVDRDDPSGTTRWRLPRRTFLVVDEANHSPDLVTDLVNFLAFTDTATRLLLVARTREPWWTELATLTENILEAVSDGDLTLREHALDSHARVTQFNTAYAAFSAVLSGADAATAQHTPESAPGADTLQEGNRGPGAGPWLESPSFGDPLMIHLAALLAASGESIAENGAAWSLRPGLLRAFLRLELNRWMKDLRARPGRLGEVDPEVVRRCVGTATISVPRSGDDIDSENEGDALLTAVPDLQDEAALRRALTRWLHYLYPGPDYWNPLRPDPFADQLLADLTVLPTLASAVLRHSLDRPSPATLNRLLTELTRASRDCGGASRTALTNLLNANLTALVQLAVAQPTAGLPQLLVAALTAAPAHAGAASVADTLPPSRRASMYLAELAVVVARQTVEYHRATQPSDRPRLARALDEYAGRLATTARHTEALAAIEEAVRIYTELRQEQPGEFDRRLADATLGQAVALSSVGRLTEALDASRVAVKMHRRLNSTRRNGHAADLIMALLEHANVLSAIGSHRETLNSLNEAVAMLEHSGQQTTDELRELYAGALNNRSNVLDHLDQPEQAYADVERAVGIWRELADARPDIYEPELALTLNNRSSRLSGLGRDADGLASSAEAVALYRRWADSYPMIFQSELCTALVNQSNRLGGLGRDEEALAVIEEAASISARLATSGLPPRLADHANVLRNKSLRLTVQRQWEDARAAQQKSVDIYRDLAVTQPQTYRKHVAAGLIRLSEILSELGRHSEALAADQEAVQIYSELAADDFATYGEALRHAREYVEIDLHNAALQDQHAQTPERADP